MPVTPVIVPSPNVGTHGYTTIVDVQGYPIGSIANSDGATFGSISGESQFLYNGGGPPLLDGSPSQLTFERTRSYMGKLAVNGAISSTTAGDTNLTFSAAPKTIMPGMALAISAGGANTEYVIVSSAYVPSAVTVVIPLQSPVINSGQTLAAWDTFSYTGPNNTIMSPLGVGLQVLALVGTFTSQLTAAVSAGNDAVAPNIILEVVHGLLQGATVERQRGPNVFKPFNAQAVTIAGGNTPTAIWTPAAGKKFRLMGYWFSSTVAASILFHDLATVGGTGLLNCPSPLMAAAGSVQCPPIGNGILSAAANNKLWIDATAATTLTGFCFGCEE